MAGSFHFCDIDDLEISVYYETIGNIKIDTLGKGLRSTLLSKIVLNKEQV